jgi:HEAT repeat protein
MSGSWKLSVGFAVALILLLVPMRVLPAQKVESPNEGVAKPQAPEQPGLPEVEVDLAALAERLAAEDPAEVLAAHAQLRKLPKNARRVTILKLSSEGNVNLRADLWRSYANWVREEDVPLLIDALGSRSPDVRSAAAELLARYPEGNNLRWLARQLMDPYLRERVQNLLVEIGPAAEEAVLPYASESDHETRAAAWETLGQIGGRTALRQLRQQAAQPAFAKDETLQQAIARIAPRVESSR